MSFFKRWRKMLAYQATSIKVNVSDLFLLWMYLTHDVFVFYFKLSDLSAAATNLMFLSELHIFTTPWLAQCILRPLCWAWSEVARGGSRRASFHSVIYHPVGAAPHPLLSLVLHKCDLSPSRHLYPNTKVTTLLHLRTGK